MGLKLLLLSLEINIDFSQIGCFPVIGDRQQPGFGETVDFKLGINSVLPLMQNERRRNRISIPGMNSPKKIYISL